MYTVQCTLTKVFWLNWDLDYCKYLDPFEPKGSNGWWFSRRCSRPATRPCTFVINPSFFFTLKMFLLLKWPFFVFYEKLRVIYLKVIVLNLHIYLFIYLYIYLSIDLKVMDLETQREVWNNQVKRQNQDGKRLQVHISFHLYIYLSIYLKGEHKKNNQNTNVSVIPLWMTVSSTPVRESFVL